jgi:hypothetical protein
MPERRVMARLIALAGFVFVVAIAACTPDSTTGPHPDVTGSWTLQGVFVADSDTLQLTSLVMALRQSGTAFTGSYTGAVISVYGRDPNNRPPCAMSAAPASGSISSGTATGVTVGFTASLTNQPFKGVLTDSAMQGGTTIYSTGCFGSSEKFVGGWTAQRN